MGCYTQPSFSRCARLHTVKTLATRQGLKAEAEEGPYDRFPGLSVRISPFREVTPVRTLICRLRVASLQLSKMSNVHPGATQRACRVPSLRLGQA
jgi:hypothetical protein